MHKSMSAKGQKRTPTVKGSVTLVLDEVPWDQALDIVMRNNGLSKELDGNVLRIATRDTLKREANDQRDLAESRGSMRLSR